jgi:radical SAM protein with 4Fe4S-binding SPASM domain
MIELTLRCNLSCAHCYVNLTADNSKAIEEELTSQEICHIIDEIAEEGCLWLTLTGGEPLVRDDFLDIYTYAKKKGLIITIFTNGTLITPQMADFLREWPPYLIEISLHGITKETYERVTGIPGSFERCLRGIELLLEQNIALSLKTVIMTLNHHELRKIKDYVKKLGVDFRFDALINLRPDGDKNPAKVRLSPAEVVAIDLADEERLGAWKEFWQTFNYPPNSDNLYTCGAGLSSFHINPYGQISLCGIARNPSYNLRQGNFRTGFYNFFPAVRARKINKDYRCRNCRLISLCGQCPGWAELENRDQETPVDYLCRIAHLRAKAFNLENPSNLPETQKEVNGYEKEALSKTSY